MIFKSTYNVDISVGFMQYVCSLNQIFVVLLDYFTQNLKSKIIFGNSREYLPKDAE
jgi:hypothetical protein